MPHSIGKRRAVPRKKTARSKATRSPLSRHLRQLQHMLVLRAQLRLLRFPPGPARLLQAQNDLLLLPLEALPVRVRGVAAYLAHRETLGPVGESMMLAEEEQDLQAFALRVRQFERPRQIAARGTSHGTGVRAGTQRREERAGEPAIRRNDLLQQVQETRMEDEQPQRDFERAKRTPLPLRPGGGR